MESLSGIHYLHRLVVYLYSDTKTSSRINILCWENAQGNGELVVVFLQVKVVFECSTLTISVARRHHITATHTALATT